MTRKQQKRFYFPAWNKCAAAMGWRGDLQGAESGFGRMVEGLEGVLVRVYLAAGERARQEHRAVTAEDLRHGCHQAVMGKDKRSIELDNTEVDRVVSLWRVLADPDNLDARIAWDHPEEGRRERLIWGIKHAAPEAYINEVCKRRSDWAGLYEWPYWELLPMWALQQLRRTLSERQRGWARDRRMEGAEAEVPF